MQNHKSTVKGEFYWFYTSVFVLLAYVCSVKADTFSEVMFLSLKIIEIDKSVEYGTKKEVCTVGKDCSFWACQRL